MKTVITSLVVLCAATLSAQVSETIDVRIVNVDVTVTSKGGPVRGLTRDDFEIFEDGRHQAITNFYASEETRAVATAAAAAPAAPAAAAVAPAEPDPRYRRKVLVLVDNNHTTRHGRDTALRALEAMINDRFHGDYEWSIGVIGRGVTLVLPLSSNKAAIHEALEIIRRAGTRGEATSTFAGVTDRGGLTLKPTETAVVGMTVFDRDYFERLAQAGASDDTERAIAAKFTAPAILDAARGFASTSGRKIVFFLTGDPGLNDVDFVIPAGNGFNVRGVTDGKPGKATELWDAQKAIEELRKAIIHEANSSDVSFYIWNVEGLKPMGDIGSSGSQTSSQATNTSAVFWLANQTGGRLVTGNDPARAVQEFDTASSTFYSLGYSPIHPDDGKYHAISVRLKRKGDYKLEYRTGYSSNPTAMQLERAMSSPTAAAMQPTGLPVTLAIGTPSSDGNEVNVPIE
ncbi:MAG TPA: VWA domain-containing protein, partial [Thermoanaerobaculia bacterium]|nr:VWA domain-containing protein [Thermoanaerobaculia bacterium]